MTASRLQLDKVVEGFQNRFPRPRECPRKTVYHYDDSLESFSRPVQSSDLQFDSHFESGNLLKAMRVTRPTSDGALLRCLTW